MSQATPARFAVKNREHSAHVKCAMQVCVSPVELRMMRFASIAERQDARFVASSCHHVLVTDAEN